MRYLIVYQTLINDHFLIEALNWRGKQERNYKYEKGDSLVKDNGNDEHISKCKLCCVAC